VNTPVNENAAANNKYQAAIEVALVFVVFLVQGAWPVPEVNEPYYLGKAINYWSPGWIENDFFLQTADSHATFYFTFGWLSLLLTPLVLAWFGRVLTWILLAWSWRRLNLAVLPRPWFSVLSAALFVCMADRCHMAGEWVFGGLEAKGFAFVLVFLGMEALIKNRWNRVWLLLGAASAFHVLVGGWAVVCAGLAWIMLAVCRRDVDSSEKLPTPMSMLPALLGGFVLSLPGLLPAAALNVGVHDRVVALANHVYVYERLSHHLSPMQIPTQFIVRFSALVVLAVVIFSLAPRVEALRRLQAFVIGTMLLALIGVVIGIIGNWAPEPAAALLRFYWFRLADVIVPLGIAVVGCACIAEALRERPPLGRVLLSIGAVIGVLHVGGYAKERLYITPPRACRMYDFPAWRHICERIAEDETISPDALFLTPRMSQTFKWYAQRPEVVNWKEIPQDAEAMVEWWRRIEDIHATGESDPLLRWHYTLARQGPERLKHIGRKYGADYAVTLNSPRLPLPVVHLNRRYVVYDLREGAGDLP